MTQDTPPPEAPQPVEATRIDPMLLELLDCPLSM